MRSLLEIFQDLTKPKKSVNTGVKSQKNVDEFTQLTTEMTLLGDNPPIFYLCNDPERALGLEKIISNFHIVCTDNTPIVDGLMKQGLKVFSLSRELGEGAEFDRNSNKLLQHPKVLEYITTNTPQGQIAHLMVFKIAPNLEVTAKQHGFKFLNTTSQLNHLFENKISQYKELFPIGTKFPRTKICKLATENYHTLSKEFGSQFVVQFDRGHTGLGTMFINSEKEYSALSEQFPNREVKVAEMISGEAWTLNACVTRNGVAMGGLCYQVTGVKSLTDYKGGTVGNDWSKVDELSTSTILNIIYQTELIGDAMYAKGYRGLFGIDLIIEPDGEIYIIEINARQPASTGMHTKLMLKDGLVPLSLFHIAEFLYPDNASSAVSGHESSVDSNLAEISTDNYSNFINDILHNYQIKFANYNEPVTISSEYIRTQNQKALQSIEASQLILRKLKNGKHKVNVDAGVIANSQFLRAGFSIEDLKEAPEMLLIKQENVEKIKEGYEVARIQALSSHEAVLKQFKKLID